MPHDRSRLLLGVGEKDTFCPNRLYAVDEVAPSAGGRLWLSYPYARQIGDKLHVVYSCECAPKQGANNNDSMLAIIDVNLLT